MREHLFRLPEHAQGGLQAQIRELLVSAILDGHIPAGSALPSCRKLARQLGVARNTVVIAYQHLVDEGYLEAWERSGYYVNGGVLEGHAKAPHRNPEAPSGAEPDWNSRLQVTPSVWPSPARPKDWQHYRYPFVYGQIDPALFPISDWRECSKQALSVSSIRNWANDRIDHDDPDLVEQLQTRVLPRRGVWAQPEEILVTLGAQQALYLLAALLIGAGDRTGIEEPGYADARNILRMHAGMLEPIPVDGDGLVIDERIKRCDYLYVTPSHQCPTTVTMPLERRMELLKRAGEDDFIIIEDDYESETNYLGAPTPALKSLDTQGRVIYVGSLSKTLAPGLRLGFMVAPPTVIEQARALRRFMLRYPPSNNAKAAALFLSLGHHDSLVRRLSLTYRRRWEVMSAALNEHLPGAAISRTFGGSSFWVHGPQTLDVRKLHQAAAARSILIEPGEVHFAANPAPRHCFRLGFSAIATDRIEAGISALAVLAHELL
ncbi:MAG: aminotransferase class I/II-fold pyridoxal phosphate-dependent enzyme [Gammaproteobacteria bacterium]|nr:aminotransferase class I/II-fold pyridoxal phosphate-dependent enzyme [Gammaproteobacteria bacterium]